MEQLTDVLGDLRAPSTGLAGPNDGVQEGATDSLAHLCRSINEQIDWFGRRLELADVARRAREDRTKISHFAEIESLIDQLDETVRAGPLPISASDRLEADIESLRMDLMDLRDFAQSTEFDVDADYSLTQKKVRLEFVQSLHALMEVVLGRPIAWLTTNPSRADSSASGVSDTYTNGFFRVVLCAYRALGVQVSARTIASDISEAKKILPI